MLPQSNLPSMSVGQKGRTPPQLKLRETSMARADVAEYAHLRNADLDARGQEPTPRASRDLARGSARSLVPPQHQRPRTDFPSPPCAPPSESGIDCAATILRA